MDLEANQEQYLEEARTNVKEQELGWGLHICTEIT